MHIFILFIYLSACIYCDKNNDELIPQLDDFDNKIDEYLNAIKHTGNYGTYELYVLKCAILLILILKIR